MHFKSFGFLAGSSGLLLSDFFSLRSMEIWNLTHIAAFVVKRTRFQFISVKSSPISPPPLRAENFKPSIMPSFG
jgi:hypothetical protein